MAVILLWIVGVYAGAALCAYLMSLLRPRGMRRHYVLVAGDDQQQIEGYVRSLRRQAKLTGKEIGITVLLVPGASDETGAIVERLLRMESDLCLVRQPVAEGAEAIHNKEEWVRLTETQHQSFAWAEQDSIWLELPAVSAAGRALPRL